MKIVVESWNKKFDKLRPVIRKTALQLARFLGKKDNYLEIYLVSDSFMEKNVLAFPAPNKFPRPDLKKKIKALGEIYLNPDYISRQAAGDKRQELLYMFTHGFLHLLGYDHKRKSDTIRMERKEAELLSKIIHS